MASRHEKTDAEKKVEGDLAKMDLYGLLEVDPAATEKAILKAYRKKALKCHPDKNPDNPKAAEMFHTLSTALQVLTDAPARAAYDKIVKARKAAEERNEFLDSKRKKFKQQLEARERQAQEERDRGPVVPDLTQAERLQKEILRLRKEGSRMLEEEQERLRQEIQAEKQAKRENISTEEPPRLKIKWQAVKNDPQNGGYSHNTLYTLLDKYGKIAALIVSKKKMGSAIVEFAQPGAATLAFENERGLVQNPLNISWLSGKPVNSQSDETSDPFQPPQLNQDILSGFSFSSGAFVPSSEQSTKTVPQNDFTGATGSPKAPEVKSKWDEPSGGRASDDFESLVLRNLRQAQERKRLEQEILEANI